MTLPPSIIRPRTPAAAGAGPGPDTRGGAMMAVMTLSTAFTELFSVPHPIALAPMGGSAGGALAAAVSNGGGLGLLGGGPGDRAGWTRELPIVAAGTEQPWGVGFQSWAVDVGTVERALEHRPRGGDAVLRRPARRSSGLSARPALR